mgnify:CR=1 FL=1
MSAADYLDLVRDRRRWIAEIEAAVEPYDALLSPTVPMVAPPLAPLLPVADGPDAASQRAAKAADQRFFMINTLLLRNPSVVNMLDGCALSLPCQSPGQLPVGLMVWAPAMADDRVLGVSLAIESALAAAEAR